MSLHFIPFVIIAAVLLSCACTDAFSSTQFPHTAYLVLPDTAHFLAPHSLLAAQSVFTVQLSLPDDGPSSDPSIT